jgi:tetratricopeptide (TPR) repeat protein
MVPYTPKLIPTDPYISQQLDYADLYYETGISYLNLEEYKSALQNFERAFEIYERYTKEEKSAYCLDKMGVCCLKLRKYYESYDYLTKAYNRRKQIYPNRVHPDVLISLNSLASYYDSVGNYPSADQYREEAAKVRDQLGQVKDADYATSINNLGVSYLKMGDLKLAIDYIEQAYNIRKDLHQGRIHHDLASSLFNLAVLYFKMKSLSLAIKYAHESLEMRQRLHEFKAHTDIGDTLSLLGILYFEQGQYKTSESFNTKALDIRKLLHMGNHPKVANSLYNLGLVYGKLGDYSKSTEYLNRSHEMRKAFFENKNSLFQNGNINY